MARRVVLRPFTAETLPMTVIQSEAPERRLLWRAAPSSATLNARSSRECVCRDTPVVRGQKG
jgi:hypothetical protein